MRTTSATSSARQSDENESDGLSRRRGVLLVNVGTPESLEVGSVRRYLAEFLGDPHVIQLPRRLRWMQRFLAGFIAWRRAGQSLEKYRLIWTDRGSPLRAIVEDQAKALSACLPDGWDVFIGMRYGRPSIAEALQRIAGSDIEELVVVPLYPQFSGTTTGTTVEEVYRLIKRHALHVNVNAVTKWYNDAGYLNAQAQLIADFARERQLDPESAFLLFSAHGLPVSYVQRGDPYERQLTQSLRLLVERLGWPEDRQQVAFQSRMGPAQWLEPELTATLRKLAQRGERNVIVCPVSFAADCLETLEELKIRANELFASLGGTLHVCPALNTNEQFIEALRELVLRGSRPVLRWGRGHEPLIRPKRRACENTDAQLGRLVMVGVSLANRLGPGRGPQLAYVEPQRLACVKKPHHEIEQFLANLKEKGQIAEAFVWNTCYRFECYAWLKENCNGTGAGQACAVSELRRELFAGDAPAVQINTLFGRNAWHHLMRTIAGLNSGLPGDKDIVGQFRTAFQLAERAKMVGPHARSLVDEAIQLAEGVRKDTPWGGLDPGYCHAALSRIEARLPVKLANLRHVVVGGSTTSRSVLASLYEHFAVKESDVTLAYRNHQGGQMKLLRQAVRHGRRLRVGSYTEAALLTAITDADVVYFGIDREETVLDTDTVPGLRDLNERPLYILDFNTAGSTNGLKGIEGVRLWSAAELDVEVEAFADAMCSDEEFCATVEQAEQWIEQRAPVPAPPSLELPCQDRDDNGYPTCTRCGRMLAAVEERSAV